VKFQFGKDSLFRLLAFDQTPGYVIGCGVLIFKKLVIQLGRKKSSSIVM